jgi:hypothetical protein
MTERRPDGYHICQKCHHQWRIDETPKPKTNGDVIMQGGNRALVNFHLMGTCDTCTYYNKEHTNHNDICLCPPKKTCADGIEAWLNAPAEGEVAE